MQGSYNHSRSMASYGASHKLSHGYAGPRGYGAFGDRIKDVGGKIIQSDFVQNIDWEKVVDKGSEAVQNYQANQGAPAMPVAPSGGGPMPTMQLAQFQKPPTQQQLQNATFMSQGQAPPGYVLIGGKAVPKWALGAAALALAGALYMRR